MAFSIAADIVVSLSAIVVATAAYLGVNTWRKEVRGKATFDLARKIITQCHRLRAELTRATFLVTWHGEASGRPRRQDESAEQSEVLDEWYSRDRRVQRVAEQLPLLEELSWEAEALLDKNAHEAVSEAARRFRERYASVVTAVSDYFELTYQEAGGKDIRQHLDFLKGLRKDIYSVDGDNSLAAVDQAISQVSFALKRYVR